MDGVELRIMYGVSQALISTCMNAADVLLVTSLHEGGPLVVREALACGLPVVSVDVGDVKSRLSRFPECKLCSDDSPGTIADNLLSVLNQAARLDPGPILQDIDDVMLSKKVIEIYQKVIKN